MLKIYYADTSCVDLTDTGLLSTYRRGRLEKQAGEKSKRESLGVERLLNIALSELCPGIRLPADIVCDEYGKPGLPGKEIYFSLSHSGGFVACAVGDTELGIDIQLLTSYREKMAARYFHPAENEFLKRSKDRDGDFTRLWCMKESYVKAHGKGLSMGLEQFNALELPCIWSGAFDRFYMAVCVRGGEACVPDSIEYKDLNSGRK